MNYTVSSRNNGLELWVNYHGKLTASDIDAAWEERLQDKEVFSNARFLVADYSEASMAGISMEELRRLAEWPEIAMQFNPDVTMVILQTEDLNYGLSRVWHAHSGFDRLTWRVVFVKTAEDLEAYLEHHAV